MNKKFLSAILFGALMVTSTGTFVSCKDYDDDVTELWDAINGQKTDLTAKVTAVEASITSLQTAQSALETKIAEAKDAAEKAALEAQKAAIAAAAEELAGVKVELEAAIAKLQSATEEEMTAIKADVTEIEGSIAEVNGKVNALQAFQTTTEGTLDALAKADATLSSALTTLADEVKANAIEIGKNKAAIEAQQKALEDYILSNDDAVATNKGKIEEILVKLGEHQTVLDKLNAFDVAETQQAIADLTTNYGKLSGEISTISDQLEILSAATFTGITHVSLIESITGNQSYSWTLDFTTITEKTNEFGKGTVTEPLVFEAGKQVQRSVDFIIRVSPTNAALDKSMITLQNSLGEALDIVNIAEVSTYNELITRAVSKSGLWKVTAQLSNYDEKTFNAAKYKDVENEDGEILYAVAINNTKEAAADRNVVSSYDLSLDYTDYAPATDFFFMVGDKNVTNVNNRYSKLSKSITDTKAVITYEEKVWEKHGKAEIPAVTPVTKEENATDYNAVNGDNRDTKEVYNTIFGKSFTVALTTDGTATEAAPMKDIKAMYVTLDRQNAVESDKSEINSWDNFKYTNLNTITTDGTIDITVDLGNNTSIIDEIIGFRVYAVNWDGTLVDPDGKAFYVRISNPAAIIGNISTEIVASKTVADMVSEKKAVDVSSIKTGTGLTATWVSEDPNEIIDGEVFNVIFLDKNGAPLGTASQDNVADYTKVASIQTQFSQEARFLVDNYTYNGKLTLTNDKNQVVAVMEVSAKKIMPEGAPKEFSVKVNQMTENNSVYTCYLVPENGFVSNNPSANGTMDLKNVFNGLDEFYVFTFGTSALNGEKEVNNVVTDGAREGVDYVLTVANSFIDRTEGHASKAEYNYGNISRTWDAETKGWTTADWKQTAATFTTKYACVYDEEVMTWAWAKNYADPAKKLVYGVDGTTLDLAKIAGTNTYDPNNFSKDLKALLSKGLTIDEAHLYSKYGDENTKDEYFTVAINGENTKELVFSHNPSMQTVPTDPVASTLVIIAHDMYEVGNVKHPVIIKLPVTVNKVAQ